MTPALLSRKRRSVYQRPPIPEVTDTVTVANIIRQGIDFSLMVRALDCLPGCSGSNPINVWEFSAMLHSFVTASMSLDGGLSEIILHTMPIKLSRHHK